MMMFDKGETVVEPTIGICTVVGMKRMNVDGQEMTMYIFQAQNAQVYVPEDQYGEIMLGDSAVVSVDSFPDEFFDAVVTRIADQAEYTPRNVQTEEDRKTTVFAVELSVEDLGGKLKPGMPADVTFGE